MSTSSVQSALTASSKPWHLTFFERQVYIWKSGSRMKLKDGSSSGPVTTISFERMDVVSLKGHLVDGTNRYSFSCQLSKFITDANEFCAELAPFVSDGVSFCAQLCEQTNGVVGLESTSSDPSPSPSLPSSTSTGQKRGTSTRAPSAKKKKTGYQEKMSILGEEIPEHQIGVYDLPIDLLREPPDYLRVREVKEWFVDYLVDMLREEESDHEDLTAPLLVIASCSKEEFRPKYMQKYTYEVIGGIQRWNAIQKVNATSTRIIKSRKCAVYGKEMSRAAALMLAKQHNEFNSIQRTTGFAELAGCCRRLYFAHFAKDGETDDGVTNLPKSPYNCKAYRAFKQECLAFLLSSQTSQAMIEQAIQMALQPASIYHKMQQVFTMYEEGRLKGQRPQVMKGATIQRAMEGKLAAKLPQFKLFQGLDDGDKELLLDELLNGIISFSEAEEKSRRMKSLGAAKAKLLDEVNIETWEEAERVIPNFAKEDVLSNYHIQTGKAIPRTFKALCERAKATISGHSQVVPVLRTANISILVANYTQLGQIDFESCTLLLLNMKDVCSNMDVEDIMHGVTSGLQNSVLAVYNVENFGSKIQALCIASGATCSRSFRVTTVLCTYESMSAGECIPIILSWWGPDPIPDGHILSDNQINSLVCHPDQEDTFISSLQCLGWIKLLLNSAKPKVVADVYSTSGELAQMCNEEGILCSSVHPSREKALSIAANLGIESTEQEPSTNVNEIAAAVETVGGGTTVVEDSIVGSGRSVTGVLNAETDGVTRCEETVASRLSSTPSSPIFGPDTADLLANLSEAEKIDVSTEKGEDVENVSKASKEGGGKGRKGKSGKLGVNGPRITRSKTLGH